MRSFSTASQHVDPQVRPIAADHAAPVQRLNGRQRRCKGRYGAQRDEAMGEGAVAEAALQRPGEEPEQPSDFGGRQVDVGVTSPNGKKCTTF